MRESEKRLEREVKGGYGKARVAHQGGASDQRPGYVKHLDRSVVSFFFTDLPEYFKVSDPYKVFWGFGKVCEVYVPLKTDRWG